MFVRLMGNLHRRSLPSQLHIEEVPPCGDKLFYQVSEVGPRTIIMVQQVQKFMWKLICCFGLPRIVIIDNGRQFIDKKLAKFCKNLDIKHVTISLEHQTNDQAEAIKKTIVAKLKYRLGDVKGAWWASRGLVGLSLFVAWYHRWNTIQPHVCF